MTEPVVWLAYARIALAGKLTGRELADELERLRDDRPRSLFDDQKTQPKEAR
jgi:hypothetical protein